MTPPVPAVSALRISLRRFFASRGIADSDIDDLVQDVFLRIVRRKAEGDIDNFESYALTTAGSVLADRFRRGGPRKADDAAVASAVRLVEEVAPDRILEGRQALRATTRAILELPERPRRVFVLRRMEELSFAEIAKRLGVSISTAEKDMQQALRHLIARTGGLK